jgi:hypothetical protein
MEAVWFYQHMLLAEKRNMNDIIHAVQKVYDPRE